jgi:hypothetical protein
MLLSYTLPSRFIDASHSEIMRGQYARRGISVVAVTAPARDSAL